MRHDENGSAGQGFRGTKVPLYAISAIRGRHIVLPKGKTQRIQDNV
jgi:hypothetical protein